MRRIWTRNRAFMTALWVGTLLLEAGVFVLADRTDNSWVLLLGVALLVIPFVATDVTVTWFRRRPRARW